MAPADPQSSARREEAARGPVAGARPARGIPLRSGGLTIRMATAFGFCQGVRRAVDRALLAAAQASPMAAGNPTARDDVEAARLFVTGEIIHNPAIHQRLLAAGARRLPPPGTFGRLAAVRPTDRVIVPAFGIELSEEEQLQAIGCEIVDTTCGWVRKVWRAVHEFAADGLTVIVHGRAEHEETRATVSRIPGPYVILRDHAAAVRLASRLGGGAPAPNEPAGAPERDLCWELGGGCSPGFDPGRDLERLGLVNQTTMLSSETAAIAATLREVMQARLGHPPPAARFRTLDTFCPATQHRQDAVRQLLATHPIDAMIVVGGFRSSNTGHLARLASEQVPTYHVEDSDCLISPAAIRHLPVDRERPAIARGWFPELPATIGITAGASTPDEETDGIISRLIELRGARAEEPASRSSAAGEAAGPPGGAA